MTTQVLERAGLTVLDPRPAQRTRHVGGGPAAGALRGKRVGLRADEFWQSWDKVIDEWAALFREAGAEVVIWRAPVMKQNAAPVAGKSFRTFLDGVDVAVVGLCNCGSCTLWAVHDAVAALDYGLPTTLVATEHFVRLARTLSGQAGRPDVRVAALPYPLEGRAEDEVRQIAREHFAVVLAQMEATV